VIEASEVVFSLDQISRNSAVGVGVSVVGLLVSLLGYLRIRRVGNAIRHDRDLVETFLALPEIRFHLHRASHFLSATREEEQDELPVREALRDGLRLAHRSIDQFVMHLAGRWEVGNPYLLEADRCRKRGAVERAIYWYETALERSEVLGVSLAEEEIQRCFTELQECHFMRFDRTRAKETARRAKKFQIAGCRSEDEIRRRGWLYCGIYCLVLSWRRLRHLDWRKSRFPAELKKN